MQRLHALERANRVRTVRCQLKRQIAAGESVAAEALLSDRWEIQGMQIAELLRSQPQWGSGRCHDFLHALAMTERKTVGSMTARQRIAAAALLNRDAARRSATRA